MSQLDEHDTNRCSYFDEQIRAGKPLRANDFAALAELFPRVWEDRNEARKELTQHHQTPLSTEKPNGSEAQAEI